MAFGRITTALAVAGLLAGCATAPADPIDWWRVMPPQPYQAQAAAGLASGEYVIRQLMPARLMRTCDGNPYACAVMVCIIYTRRDIAAWPEYWAVLEHEAGHCEGWPADHPDAQPLP